MADTGTCVKCQSEKIMPRVRLEVGAPYASAGGVVAVVDEEPEAMLLKLSHEGLMHVRLCGECGFAEFFVENPRELYEAYKRSQAR
jgi:hypothetical protein